MLCHQASRPFAVVAVLCFGSLFGSGCGGTFTAKPSAVVLVTIDTLRADYVGVYGGKVATPHLDALAAEGTMFLDAVVHSPLTLPSYASILTGTYPIYHGVRDNGHFRLADEIETLAEILKKAGYATGAFVGAFPVDSRFGLNQGFDVYDDRFSSSSSSVGLAERRAEEVVAAATNWIGGIESGPYFVWVHVFDPHAPYAPPDPFRKQSEDLYGGEVAYVDHALERLFSAIGEEALTIVTADHGEGLGEHGEDTHSLFIYDTTMRVPLIMKGPQVPSKTVVDQPVRSIDILPTVLDLVGEEDACTACQGSSLLALMQTGKDSGPRASYGETYFPLLNMGWSELRSIRKDGWKYIAAPKPELYDVTNDPRETENLAGSRAKELKGLAAELAAVEKATAGPFAGLSKQEPAPATLSVLRTLGYVSARQTPARSGPLPDPKDKLPVWQKVHAGIEFMGQGEFAQAISHFAFVLKEDDATTLVRTYLGDAYIQQGRYQEAAEQFGNVLTADPGDSQATFLLGKSLLRLGKTKEAKDTLEEAARLEPGAPEPLAELANLYLQRRSLSEAQGALQRAKQRDAASPAVLVVEGKLLMLEGKGQEAEAVFRMALAAVPFEEESRVQLVNLLLSRRQLDEAQSLAREGLATRPQSVPLRVGLGHSLALAGRMSEAITVFEEALDLAPESTLILNSLGFAYLEANRPQKALPLLRRSLAIEPNQAELLSLLQQGRSQ